ncbi:MAG: YceI family protein [Actinomycetota bacterium]
MATYEFLPESVLEIHANSSVHPIHGETHALTGKAEGEIVDGAVVLDPTPTGYFEIPIDAMKSGHKLQDMEMRRRVEAKKYPTIRYEVANVSGGPDTYQVTGSLTFHGVTREFTEDVKVEIDGDSFRAEGEHTMDIRDYDMKPPKILNLQVYPEIKVKVRVAAKKT